MNKKLRPVPYPRGSPKRRHEIAPEEKPRETHVVGEFLPVRTPANLPLRNADDVRVEMARVYREMRSGQMDLTAGAKLVWSLSQLNRAIETSVIELRMEALERVLRIKR